jgi:hypothetical protein
VVLMRHTDPHGILEHPALPDHADPFRRVQTVGVLARADEVADLGVVDDDPFTLPGPLLDAAARCASGAGDLCRVVVPVAGTLALAAVTLDGPRYRAVVRLAQNGADASVDEDLVPRIGDTGLRLAVGLVRAGRAPSAQVLAETLLRRSGFPRLQEVLNARFAARAGPLKAWSVLGALDALVRAEPPSGADALLRRLERIRSNAHELMEIEAIDALRSGGHGLTGDEVEAAARLLGEFGPDPCIRLGLDRRADRLDVVAAATQALAVWRRRAAHPTAGRAVRQLANAVVQSCEQLLDSP